MVREDLSAVIPAFAMPGSARKATTHAERPSAVEGAPESGAYPQTSVCLYGSAYFLAPASLGLVSAALIPALSGLTAASAGCAALIAVTALALGYNLAARHFREIEEVKRDPQADPERLHEFCARLFPVWARQIETSRDTANDAVANLARTFSGMVDRLEATLAASRSAMSEIGAGDASIVERPGKDGDG